MALISVIIPAHNRAKLLERCLKSLVDQTFKDFEAIVIDDASTENIFEVCEQFKNQLDLTYIRNNNSMRGPARPRNIGIKASKGEWIAFLDNDDWWYPNKLERACYFFDKADVIYHELDVCDRDGKLIYKTSSRQVHSPVTADLLINMNALTNSSVVTKKSLINAVGGLDESPDLIAVEDFDLWLQLSTKTEKFHFLNEFLGGYYVGDGNISKSSEIQIKRLESVFYKSMKHLSAQDKEKAESALAYCKAHCYFQMGELKNAKISYRKSMKHSPFNLKLKAMVRLVQTSFYKSL